MKLLPSVLATVATLGFLASTQAQPLAYGSPVSVPDDAGSVFLNNGTQVFGMNVGNGGGGSHTINGVYFQNGGRSGNVQTQTQNGITFVVTASSGGSQNNGVAAGLYTNGGGGVDDPFDILNNNFLSGSPSGSITLALSGLTIGQDYQFQSFHLMNDGTQASREMTYSVGGSNFSSPFGQTYTGGTDPADISNAVAMNFNFTANSGSFTIDLLPNLPGGRSYLNGVSLTAVPEPGTIGLFVAGGLAALIAARRRRID